MAKYYYTTNDEIPAVYHNNQNCEEGLKIKAENRVNTDDVPPGRQLCKIC